MSKNMKTFKKKRDSQNLHETNEMKTKQETQPKFGPLVTFPYQRVWSRCILIFGVLLIVWYNSKQTKEISLAKQKDVLSHRVQNVECSESLKADMNKYVGCVPEKCARVVTDQLVSLKEIDILLQMALNGFDYGSSDGGVSILDLDSGALSMGTRFINIYTLKQGNKIFNSTDIVIYKVVRTKIQHAIAHNFGVDVNKIYLTKPTFFSKITNAPAKTIHDEYWNPHVDKETYESFHYTSLLYLNDYSHDFEGGRFIFIDENEVNSTIEPRKGRVSMFTSGRENLHAVEKVTSGTRYALTVSFTCDINASIKDLNFDNKFKSND